MKNPENINMLKYLLEILKILIPAVISILIVLIARHNEKQKEAEASIREQKITIYEKFVKETYTFLTNASNYNEKVLNKKLDDLTKTFDAFHKNILFWGSDYIIKQYNHFRQRIDAPDFKMEDYETLLFAFRKDVGHDDKKLETFDLLKLLLKTSEFGSDGKPINSTLIRNDTKTETITKD